MWKMKKRKRIKLTDKELAIGMWVYICLYIESYDHTSSELKWIVNVKKEWLKKHYKKSYTVSPEFYWEHDCYLCHKHWKDNCLRCPLGKCSTGSLYEGVAYYFDSKVKQVKALECAKRILNVIAKEEEHEDN